MAARYNLLEVGIEESGRILLERALPTSRVLTGSSEVDGEKRYYYEFTRSLGSKEVGNLTERAAELGATPINWGYSRFISREVKPYKSISQPLP